MKSDSKLSTAAGIQWNEETCLFDRGCCRSPGRRQTQLCFQESVSLATAYSGVCEIRSPLAVSTCSEAKHTQFVQNANYVEMKIGKLQHFAVGCFS